MQTAPATFLSPPPQNGYQPLSGGCLYVSIRSNISLIREKNVIVAEIYTIKRQYLGLLPPQQIIDICLTFEAHVPLQIKSSVWPYDIRAAIASIQAQKAQVSQTQTSLQSDVPSRTSAPDVDSSSGEKTRQPSAEFITTAGSPASVPSVSKPVTSQSQIPPTAPGPHHPHQPYYHPTYPHAPYYTPPHATYGYPHPYPSYPQPPAPYPVNPGSHHPPLFTNTSLVHPPHPAPEPPPPLNNADDLPSYEEMIVEALLDSGDPEGCAPKSLFSWMAMHYPLQMNFRPSASQALQKAYKRGRLEKGSNGKYRLNENWEGGNTSRRTTRRPQTLAQTTLPSPQPPSSSPFTHTPLIPHGTTNLQACLPPPAQPTGYGGYPFGYPYQGTSGSVHAPVARDSLGTTSQKQAAEAVDHEAGEGSDAWEAAQNILKAINFGQENKAGESPMSANPLDLQATGGGPGKPSSDPGAIVPEESAGSRLDGVGISAELNAEQRAALQAQLALLAAQLAELADVSEDELSHNLEVSQRIAVMSRTHTPQVLGGGSGHGDDSDVDDNEDMVEVPVPMASVTA
ncbi:hypothetical protein J3R82DRAFT_9619 [Butyriboletus roseoflavus]|nr:hypothetical protein J3R82DRAFT_9619 [Butyriboletus roseoflavus]